MRIEDKLLPNYRFKKFLNFNQWEKYSLGDIAEITKLAGFEYTKYIKYTDIGYIIALRGLNVKKGQLNLEEVKYIDGSDFSKLSRSKLFIGDVLFTYVGTIGELAVVPENDKYYLAPNVARLRFNRDFSPLFISQIMGSRDYYNKIILPLIATSSQLALSMANIRKFELIAPSYIEQTKIAEFFKTMDNLVNLQQQKTIKLKDLKSAYLNDMFPKEGESVPKLRFAGFKKQWKKVKLGEKYSFLKGKGLPLSSFYEGRENPSIAYGHLYTKYSEVIEEVNVSSRDTGILSRYGDLLFPGSSTVPNGTAQSNAILIDDVHLGWDIIIGRPVSNGVDSVFFSYHINSKKERLYPITSGTTITHMYGKDLENIEYFMPNILEQVKIGEFFRNLDNQIKLQEDKLEKLKQMKQAYLNEMFV